MSDRLSPLNVSTWNIAANNQTKRIGRIAEYLAMQEPGITILTELTAISGLQRALTNELGQEYSLDTINTGGTRYEDNVGLLLTGPDLQMTQEVEPVPTYGDKMRSILRARLATPLGTTTVVGMRGAYVGGKGTFLSTGAAERKAQYQTIAEAALQGDGVALIGGDTNSFVRTHDPIFRRNGFHRLTGTRITWPDKAGLKLTTMDSRIMAAPFLFTRQGLALDVLYGNDLVDSVDTTIDATGISDHMFVKTSVVEVTRS